ncbi:MAG: bifunctional phosphoglucose/phosphomannose isomerase [bacterium]
MNNDVMLKLIEDFPVLVKKGYSLKCGSLNLNRKSLKNIVYAGMGGSALAGDVIKELLYPFSGIPMEVVRNYNLPEYVDKNSLVIISSFSGNTEETLSCFKFALKKNAKILAVSSGGDVEKIAKKNNTPFIKLPVSIPPRTAFGMTLFALLRRMEFLTPRGEISKMTADALSRMDDYSFDYENAKLLSKIMQDRIPLFYVDSSFSSVGRRCANQVSENSKQFAHFNLIPEMNHNEIVGLKMPKHLEKNIAIFFISFRQDNPRNRKRAMITKKIADENKFETISLDFEDKNPLYNIIDAVILFDLASYYLALYNKTDAVAIERINILKSRIKK